LRTLKHGAEPQSTVCQHGAVVSRGGCPDQGGVSCTRIYRYSLKSGPGLPQGHDTPTPTAQHQAQSDHGLSSPAKPAPSTRSRTRAITINNGGPARHPRRNRSPHRESPRNAPEIPRAEKARNLMPLKLVVLSIFLVYLIFGCTLIIPG
jgi:hypothetical protein